MSTTKEVKRNKKGQFIRGQLPWNTGMRMCSPQWNGGETTQNSGRVMAIVGYKDNGQAIYRERSRIRAEEILGRPLISDEIVHHVDGDKSNDAPDNLAVITFTEHNRLHKNWLYRKHRPCKRD